MSYRDNEHDRTRRERDQLKQQMARVEEDLRVTAQRAKTLEHRRRAAAGQVTKLKKRAAAGVCPCCNRSFSDLRHHMAAKHPSFLAEAVEGDDVTEHAIKSGGAS